MKTYTLIYRCLLSTSIHNACQFHTDTRNLSLITPPWINVTVINMEFPMVEKSTVCLKIKRFGIPTIWNMKIDTLKCPTTITDVMVSGPFKSFRHERVFIPINKTTTQMQETLRVVLPFGWLGSLLFPFLKRDMDTMFAYRHQATQYHFLKDSE